MKHRFQSVQIGAHHPLNYAYLTTQNTDIVQLSRKVHFDLQLRKTNITLSNSDDGCIDLCHNETPVVLKRNSSTF